MFANRIDAGTKLAEKITPQSNSIVLAIPRGGVILGDVIAKKLECELDIVISKKITPPDYSEYAVGSVMSDGTLYKGEYWSEFNDDPRFDDEIKKKQEAVRRSLQQYRGHDKYFLENKYVILVDDGIATGSTVFAILEWIKKHKPYKTILAVPVMPMTTFEKMKDLVDDIIVLETPEDFSAVGQFYDDFSQVTDFEVKNVLKKYHM